MNLENRIERLERVVEYLLRFLAAEMRDAHIERMQQMLSDEGLDTETEPHQP